jgi:lipopolysaccharide transport system ATP-binding protein
MASGITVSTRPSLVDSELAIDVRNVSKRYKLFRNPVTGPVKDLLYLARSGRDYREFPAVSDVSFQVRRGEIVGIVGPNGAGKTTLLKMIAGLLPIDSGSIVVNGRVNALLALGVGVHPEFSGRENIRYSALMLGMSSAEIEAKMESIVEFAELGQFIDQPFRTYSSGMRSRLLFSISMSIDPDILIVDEALSTGDAYFVQKCGARIRDLCSRGATILFVSHNLSQIEDICQRAIFIAEGRVLHSGDPRSAIDAYNSWAFEREAGRVAAAPAEIDGLRSLSGNGRVSVREVRLKNNLGHAVTGVYTGEAMTVEIDYVSTVTPGTAASCFLGVIRASDDEWVGEISSQYHVDPVESGVRRDDILIWPNGRISVRLDPILLLNNHYHFWIMIYDRQERYCEYRGVAPFFVARRAHVFDRDPVFWQPCRFESIAIPSARVASGGAR